MAIEGRRPVAKIFALGGGPLGRPAVGGDWKPVVVSCCLSGSVGSSRSSKLEVGWRRCGGVGSVGGAGGSGRRQHAFSKECLFPGTYLAAGLRLVPRTVPVGKREGAKTRGHSRFSGVT